MCVKSHFGSPKCWTKAHNVANFLLLARGAVHSTLTRVRQKGASRASPAHDAPMSSVARKNRQKPLRVFSSVSIKTSALGRDGTHPDKPENVRKRSRQIPRRSPTRSAQLSGCLCTTGTNILSAARAELQRACTLQKQTTVFITAEPCTALQAK